MAVFADVGFGTQTGKGSDFRAFADASPLEMAKAFDFNVVFDRTARFKDNVRLDNDIFAQHGVIRKIHRLRVDHGDALRQEFFAQFVLNNRLDRRQIRAGIRARDFRFGTFDGNGFPPSARAKATKSVR